MPAEAQPNRLRGNRRDHRVHRADQLRRHRKNSRHRPNNLFDGPGTAALEAANSENGEQQKAEEDRKSRTKERKHNGRQLLLHNRIRSDAGQPGKERKQYHGEQKKIY